MLKDLYINVLIKEPNKDPKVVRIRNEVPRIQKILDGNFDLLEYNKDIFIAYNYKAKTLNMKDNIKVKDKQLKGTIIFIGNNEQEGDFRELNEKEVESIINTLELEKNVEIEL